ncbi:hypothetical protein BLNAU_22501 [Blattamonas nauphoetae]|uniref:Uncharacterized protein n=1 Tax=Blattamonas nauphoetae TaxID=2049346 RepID=A0ABQ9WSW8_9EUKA|nr:hypothetical protein BLNAU_22501 [Blattamonas nauphoetae]
MISSEDPEYSPFLKWNPTDPLTVDSAGRVFISLGSMVRDGYVFDGELVNKASKFLSSRKQLFKREKDFDCFLRAIGKESSNAIPTLVDSMTVLLFSSHHSIFKGTLTFIHTCLNWCPLSTRLAIVSSSLIPRIPSSPHCRALSLVEDNCILNDLIEIVHTIVRLSTAGYLHCLSTDVGLDPQSVRDVVLHEVLMPMEPSLVQISRNHHFLSWNDEWSSTMGLMTHILKLSPFHQPTLDFVCSSRIPIVIQSLLSQNEHERNNQFVIGLMSNNIDEWKKDGGETWCRGRILLQTQEQEGFFEGIEQILFHDKISGGGKCVRFYSFNLLNKLGLNSPRPE